MDKEFIQRIKKCGVRKLVEKFGTTLRQINEDTWLAHCPSPNHKDTHESFMVKLNPDGLESWCCYSCHQGSKDGESGNYGSDNIAFMQWMYHNTNGGELSFREAIKLIARFYGIPMASGKYDFIYRNNEQLCTGYESGLTDFVRLYLYDRGLEDSDIKKWRLGFDGDRVTFPIFNASGSIAGFSNRAFSKRAMDSGRKYINSQASPVFKKSSLLYGINFAQPEDNSLFIVEGQMDAIMAHKYGMHNAVATMTCSLSSWHINYLKEHNLSPILCYDFDEAGIDGMEKAMKALYNAGIKNIKLAVLPDKRDIADLGKDLKEGLKDFVKAHTMLYSQYILGKIADRIDSVILAEQQKCMAEVREALSSIADPDEKIVAENFVRNRIFKTWAA